MQNNQGLFFTWMQKPGIVKKLQAALVISLLFNCGLIIELYKANNHKKYSLSSSEKPKKPEPSNEIKTVSTKQVKEFIAEYLQNFFSTTDESFAYISDHTATKLFTGTIKTEILSRQTQNLASEFIISDLFIEDLNNSQIKALVIGEEKFQNSSISSREINLELIINSQKLLVEEIPRFNVK